MHGPRGPANYGFHVRLEQNGESKADYIALKVAPFIAVSHNQTAAKSVLADCNNGFSSGQFDADFETASGIPAIRLQSSHHFPQDQFEAGFTEMPAGPEQTPRMAVLLSLPKLDHGVELEKVMTDEVGVFYRFNYLDWAG